MIRSRLAVLLILLAALTLYGCSSDEQRKQSHFTKGKQYFDKGEFKSAKIEFKNAVQIDPKFVPALFMLAETSLKLGDAQDAGNPAVDRHEHGRLAALDVEARDTTRHRRVDRRLAHVAVARGEPRREVVEVHVVDRLEGLGERPGCLHHQLADRLLDLRALDLEE